MDLVPYFGETPFTASQITVQIRASDKTRAQALVKRTSAAITAVNDEATYTAARRAAGELKNFAKEIYESKRNAKRPFEAVEAAIEDLAKELSAPIDVEQNRIIELMTAHVRKLELEKKEAERKLLRQREAEERAHQEKMWQLQAEKEKAEKEARAAQDELKRREAHIEAEIRNQELLDAETARNLEIEVRAMTTEPLPGVVPGGRVTHPHKFRLVDAVQTVKAGSIRLLRIELDILACQDAVRAQLEIAPDREPTLPGIEITQETKINIKATSRIT